MVRPLVAPVLRQLPRLLLAPLGGLSLARMLTRQFGPSCRCCTNQAERNESVAIARDPPRAVPRCEYDFDSINEMFHPRILSNMAHLTRHGDVMHWGSVPPLLASCEAREGSRLGGREVGSESEKQ